MLVDDEVDLETQVTARTPSELMAACRENETEDALSMINSGVHCGARERETGWTTLHWAATHGSNVLTQALLKAGAGSAYRQAKDGLAPADELIVEDDGAAAADDDPAADPSPLPSLVMNTPLHWAAFKGHLRVVWLLLEQGCVLVSPPGPPHPTPTPNPTHRLTLFFSSPLLSSATLPTTWTRWATRPCTSRPPTRTSGACRRCSTTGPGWRRKTNT